MLRSLVGSEMCIRDRYVCDAHLRCTAVATVVVFLGACGPYSTSYPWSAAAVCDTSPLTVDGNVETVWIEYLYFNCHNITDDLLSLIHISEPTRLLSISYAVFCLKKKSFKSTPRELQCSDRAQTSTSGPGRPSCVDVLCVLAKSARTKRCDPK